MSDTTEMFASTVFLVDGKTVDANGQEVKGGKTAQAAPSSDLPDDFPERDLILGTQWQTVEALNSASDDELLAVDGIGPAKLKAIRTALKG